MITKNQIKFIRSLDEKRSRYEEKCFVAEGDKLIADTLPLYQYHSIYATADWELLPKHSNTTIVSKDEMRRISFMKAPQNVLAVYKIPNYTFDPKFTENHLILVLDGIQDPGNLGTIIRTADWYGIEHIVCSPDTVDLYNPKVIQSTMGAFSRIKVYYTDLKQLFKQLPNVPIYGTLLEGNNIYQTTLTDTGILIMGNEGKGISKELRASITHPLFLPNYPIERPCSESLNVAIATSVVCAEFRRRTMNYPPL